MLRTYPIKIFRRFSRLGSKALFLFCAFLFCGCGQESSVSDEKPVVLVTIAPYAYFVERIAGESVHVAQLVPPGVNIHVYEPTPQQLGDAQKARLWLRLGEPFEKRIFTALKEHNKKLEVIDLWKGFPLLSEKENVCQHHESEEAQDLHLWMSPKIVYAQCEKIGETLIKMFPEKKAEFETNLQSLLQDLKDLDQSISKILEGKKGTAILVSHPAFGYFCRDYGLVQLSIECSGKDPRPRDVERIIEQAKNSHVRVVFTLAAYNNKGAELIGEELKLPIYLFDPYSGDYLQNMKHLAELIAK